MLRLELKLLKSSKKTSLPSSINSWKTPMRNSARPTVLKCSLRTCWQTELVVGSKPNSSRPNLKRKKTSNKRRGRRSKRSKINPAREEGKITVVAIVNITIDKVDVVAVEIVITKTI